MINHFEVYSNIFWVINSTTSLLFLPSLSKINFVGNRLKCDKASHIVEHVGTIQFGAQDL